MEERGAPRVGLAEDRRVDLAVRVVDRADDRRVGVAAHEPEGRAELPAASEPPARARGEDVRLIEVEEPPVLLAGGDAIAPLAPRERVGEEAAVAVVARRDQI